MTKYIAYYRVSTAMQGVDGLGMDAQRTDVERYLKGKQPLAEYREVESSKDHMNRPELLKALEHCKTEDATLIVARLDRLSRNVVFIGTLMEHKTKFVCCDMPEADSFTIHIFAALAQKEREMISKRTKAALKALKDRGVKLGNPNLTHPKALKAHMDLMRASKLPKPPNHKVVALIKQFPGKTYAEIAEVVNGQDYRTPRGKLFSAAAIWRIAHLNPAS